MGRALEQGMVRRLSVFDQDSFTQHLLRLDADTRHLRFGMIASDEFVMEYARGCARWDVVIYGYFIDGILRGAAELRPLSGDARDEAEVAFSVEAGLRGRGIGSMLFEKIIRAARNHGHKRLYMSCIASNRAMQALARKFAAEITFDQGGTVGIINPPHRDAESMATQASDDASSYVFAMLEVGRRSLSDPLGWLNSR